MPMFLHYLSSSCCVGCVMDKHPTSCCEEEGHMGGDMESSFTRCTPTGSCPLSSFFLLKWKYKMKILTFALFCFPVIFFQPRRPTESWATSKEGWPARSGRGLSPSALRPHLKCCVQEAQESTRKTWSCWSRSREGPQRLSDGWSTSCEYRLRELGLFILEKRRFLEDLIAAFQYLKEAYKQLFMWSDRDRTSRNSFKLKEGRILEGNFLLRG